MQTSTTGLVYLSYDSLIHMPLKHLISGVDAVDQTATSACGRQTELTGFTEWISHTNPAITLGWDWCIEYKDGRTCCRRLGTPRSNVMLLDGQGKAHNWDCNLHHLSQAIDTLFWSETVQKCIGSD